MIRVGFIGAVSKEWMGGLNYYKNLLHAISKIEDKKIEPVVFVGYKTDESIKQMFKDSAKIIEEPMFDRLTFQWYIWRIIDKLFSSSVTLDFLLKKHHIDVLSHTGIVGLKSCKVINWIPDFQHLHLPGMFSSKEIKTRNDRFGELIHKSDFIILSSYDALKDFKVFSPQNIDKARVLQFVSQPSVSNILSSQDAEQSLRSKYGLGQNLNLFYMPNQFWGHKNHKIAFEAVRILKNKGIEVLLVCTGYMSDYRNENHITELIAFIKDNGLEDNIKLLGLIDYEDVFALINCSKSVINPSLFEGWSSTVEECKSIGKMMILSDLDVHKEQYSSAVFFDRYDPNDLAEAMLSERAYSVDVDQVEHLSQRTKNVGENYQNIVVELFE